MEKNMSEREIDKVEITLDFEDVIVQPVDGVIVQRDDEEIKLLFFYLKLESNHDEDSITWFNCAAEFRMFCSKFLDISRGIIIRVNDNGREREKISMFA